MRLSQARNVTGKIPVWSHTALMVYFGSSEIASMVVNVILFLSAMKR
jgi:hypothetical protein